MSDLPTNPAPLATVAEAIDAPVRRNRDARGLFLPGNSCGRVTRPRRVDLVQAAVEWAERNGTSLRHELGETIGRLFADAKAGNTHAARVLLDKLGSDDSLAAAFSVEFSDTERRVRLQAILSAAATRPAEGRDYEDD